MNIDTLITKLWSIREDLRGLAAQEKEFKAQYETYKKELLFQLDEQGVSGAKSSMARVVITESQVAKVVDKDRFWEYVLDSQSFHLIHKHPAATAIKELTLIQGEAIPGVELLTLRDISLTTNRGTS